MSPSKTDGFLRIIQFFSVIYTVGFTIYLPASKFSSLPQPERYRWFVFWLLAYAYLQIFPYLPRPKKTKWLRNETSRLRSTNVAITEIANCIRKGAVSDADFGRTARSILDAIKMEVEELIQDSESIYLDAALLTEDRENPELLKVLSRARPGLNHSYPKSGLAVWEAMQRKCRVYVPVFAPPEGVERDYRSILALPLVIEQGLETQCIGGVSIVSTRTYEFDGLDKKIEIKILPYISLLKLLLGCQQTFSRR